MLIVYLCGVMGVAFTPARVGAFAALVWLAAARLLAARSRPARGDLTVLTLVVASVLVWLLWRAGLPLLPLGRGDLTHHLQLVDYLERHWRLPHGADVDRYLAEMVHYTPGLHALAALVGRWTTSDGLHVIYPLVACAVATKVGLVYLIARRLLAAGPMSPTAHPPWQAAALASAALVLVPSPYVLDSFMRDGFLAQVAAETFAVAMWWALVAWDQEEHAILLGLFGLFTCGAFLTWPVWTGPGVVALFLTVVLRSTPAWRVRARHLALALALPAAIAGSYVAGRAALLGMSGASGAVLSPSTGDYGPVFLGLSAAGLLLGLRDRRARTTLWFAAGVVLQSAVLYAQARRAGNESAYMALKTLYLAPFPLAALAALPLAAAASAWARSSRRPRAMVAWASLGLALATCLTTLVTRPPEVRSVTPPLLAAGLWARAHLPRQCVAYMVPDDDSAYWLHVAVLRNPRQSPRTLDDSTYDLVQTIVRWYGSSGLPYAIADLPAVSASVRADLEILARFGDAAVVRGGARPCPDDGLPGPP